MLKQLVKTRRVWAKTVNIIKKRHQHAQILQHCLRTRFHHFYRGIRPSKLLTPVSEAIRHLKERHPTDSEYQDLPEPAQGQSITDYIDAWSEAEFLGITGQWKEEDIIAPNRLRATFPRRRGGMGFTTLKDVLPGAFAATILECLYPRGLNVLGAPKREGISLRAGCLNEC